MTQAPDIWTLHTSQPAEGESQWGGCYIVEAHAHNDAVSLREATGMDWTVVPMVRADRPAQCLHQIAEPAQAMQDAVPAGTKFFSFDPCDDLVVHDTAETACAAAQQSIDLYREDAAEGWAEEVERVCWGMILGQALETKLSEDLPPAAFAAGAAGSLPPVDYVLQAPAHPAKGVPAQTMQASEGTEDVAVMEHPEWMLVHKETGAQKPLDSQWTVRATQPAAQGAVTTGYIAPKGRYVPPVLFSPYTGEPRDARDIASDPRGILIVPPGAALAAQAKQGGANHG